MLNDNQFNVLFLCTGNSARSVMADALLNRCEDKRFRVFSAGSKPKGKVHSKTIKILEKNNVDTNSFRSKSWDEFNKTDAPRIGIVTTVCSNAANESYPVFTGTPTSIHWDVDEPAREFDSEEKQDDEFEKIFRELEQRIKNFTNNVRAEMDRTTTEENLKKIPDPK